MQNYDERLELAPRDVVSRSIILESRKTNSDEFYLDIRYKGKEYLSNRFPMIYDFLKTQGIDMGEDLIPIFPCQHYLMGGINVNTSAQTDINGLYAVGECSHTGVHGNNRLASNSLLEALVFGHRAAIDMSEKLDKNDVCEEYEFPEPVNAEPIPHGIRNLSLLSPTSRRLWRALRGFPKLRKCWKAAITSLTETLLRHIPLQPLHTLCSKKSFNG